MTALDNELHGTFWKNTIRTSELKNETFGTPVQQQYITNLTAKTQNVTACCDL